MRKLLLISVLLAGSCLGLAPAPAQEAPGGVIFSRFRQFRIPFTNAPGARLKQLQLYVSADQGRTWQPSATAPPDQNHFRFLADRDGYFWFAVQTLDEAGKLYRKRSKASPPA